MRAVTSEMAESKINIVLTTAAKSHPLPNQIYSQPNKPIIPNDKDM